VSAPPPVVAAFDVDGTLTLRDCVRPFLELVGGRRGLVRSVLRRPVASARAGMRRDRDAVKEIVVGGVLSGREATQVRELGRVFADRVVQEMLRPDVVARLRWHQQQGHRTVLVSASLRPYLEPLGATLAVDAVLCTDATVVDGRYTDRLDGPNCRAAEKAVRLHAWLAAEGLDGARLWAYGNSRGDREMLAMADRPVWVQAATVPVVPTEEPS
jgi:phosphatidylglycerophosphatase C